jgi:hypothetical protein
VTALLHPVIRCKGATAAPLHPVIRCKGGGGSPSSSGRPFSRCRSTAALLEGSGRGRGD